MNGISQQDNVYDRPQTQTDDPLQERLGWAVERIDKLFSFGRSERESDDILQACRDIIQVQRPPEKRLTWLITHVEFLREFLLSENRKEAIELCFHPWQPGQEAVAELTLRDIKRQESKTLKLRTRDGVIEFHYGTQDSTHDCPWQFESDEKAVLEVIDYFILGI